MVLSQDTAWKDMQLAQFFTIYILSPYCNSPDFVILEKPVKVEVMGQIQQFKDIKESTMVINLEMHDLKM